MGIPTIRDRVVQTAAVLVLAPIFEADLQPEQYVYREGRNAHDAVRHVHKLLNTGHTLERDAENSYLAGVVLEAGPMDQLLGSSITYRIAVGPQQGRKVFTLQTLPGCEEPFDAGVGKVAGFSLHAGVAARADQRQKLERLCRYISRPAISEKRQSLPPNGNVRYQLKTPYRDGTTHVIFEPLDFIARLEALVPKPRVNLTRFHGVFAPNSKYRARVTPAKRGSNGSGCTGRGQVMKSAPLDSGLSGFRVTTIAPSHFSGQIDDRPEAPKCASRDCHRAKRRLSFLYAELPQLHSSLIGKASRWDMPNRLTPAGHMYAPANRTTLRQLWHDTGSSRRFTARPKLAYLTEYPRPSRQAARARM